MTAFLNPRRWHPLAVPVLIALCALGAAAWLVPHVAEWLQPERQVRIYGAGEPGDGEVVELITRKRTVGEALAAAGITLAEGDRVSPALESPLAAETEIRIARAVSVVVYTGEDRQVVRTAAGRVDRLLDEMGVKLGARDRVRPGLDAPLEQGSVIRITRIHEQLRTRKEAVPFSTVRRDDPSLVKGETKVVRSGEEGLQEVVTRQVFQNGRLIREEPVATRLIKPPVSMVMAVGTTGVVSRGGISYRYREEYTMTATAYAPGDGMTPGNRTATGLPARKGVVAVDPRVIPLGTRVYVEGYGPAIAADTGGAIKGNKIDLCFDTPAEAIRFGRRTVKVYVLTE